MTSNEQCRAVGRASAMPRLGAWRRPLASFIACGVIVLVSACGAMPGKGGAVDKQALQERVDERMAAADKALKQGQTDQAMAHLDSAIQIDPASKQPWLKKAQIHFDARQYGLAISEAQEVLQRDVRDLTAQSILAVSGLRVSAQALEQLRKVNEVTGSTRSEAESVARVIHEALGEPILLSAASSSPAQPVVNVTPSAAPRNRLPAVRPRPAPGAATPVTAGPMASPPAPVPSASPARTNPFGALQ